MSSVRLALNEFLSAVQIKALRQAEIAVGNRDDALDIVQDAMYSLAKKYSDRQNEWPQLFQRILQNAIRDYFRRKKVRSILIFWQQKPLEKEDTELDEGGASEPGLGKEALEPEFQTGQALVRGKIVNALKALPIRQQQAFMLRAWVEMNTEETASAMNCSIGSVKTHYSRAIKALNAQSVAVHMQGELRSEW